jgi:hypothetical protein
MYTETQIKDRKINKQRKKALRKRRKEEIMERKGKIKDGRKK